MPSILDALDWHDLEPTPTYKRREYQFIPGPGRHDDRDGTLTIRLAKGKRAGSMWDEDTYGVLEGDPVGGHNAGRVLLLRNDTDADQPDVYEVFVADSGVPGDRCTCAAGRAKTGECKHRTCCRHMIENGLLTTQGTR